ncbi:NUC153 domain-containing protein, partial [Haematococcus lacustris]
ALLLAGGKGSKDGGGSSDDGSSSDEDEVGAGEGMHGGTEDGTGTAVKTQRQPAKRKAGSKDGLEMQVVYAPALEQLATRVAERKQAAATQTSQAGETVWQAYLRRRKEKKKERKTRAAAAQPGSDADEDPWNDPFFNQEGEGVELGAPAIPSSDDEEGTGANARRKGAAGKAAGHDRKKGGERKGKKLLGSGGGGELKTDGGGSGAAELDKAARQREAAAEEAEEAGGFHANLADVRFQNLFTDHNFALDPTDP